MNAGSSFTGETRLNVFGSDEVQRVWPGPLQRLHSANSETLELERTEMRLHESKRCWTDMCEDHCVNANLDV